VKNLNHQYHISGAVKSAVAYVLDNSSSSSVVDGANPNTANLISANSVPKVLYSETLYYEDCDSEGCTPQYNGNISRMVHHLAHGSPNYSESRDVAYAYDMLNRLTKVEDDVEDYFDEIFNYDAQGRIVQQRRGQNLLAMRYGGEYSYYTGSNQLEKVMGSMSIDDSGNKRDMSAGNNFLFDRDGNMIEDKSKEMTISYDHRGLPVEFKREVPSISGVAGEKDSVRLTLAYDGAGSRITKKREGKISGGEWATELVTHYTGIGSEIREDSLNNVTKVVVNLPQGLGRYDIENASSRYVGIDPEQLPGYIPSAKFEWYLKNHLGSTMLVYGTQSYYDSMKPNYNGLKFAYDYRAFGEQVDLTRSMDKVTETFTGKEKDDETELSYFGARYLDQMLGMWVSVDAKRQFNSPYLYAGNGTNPINGVDGDGNKIIAKTKRDQIAYAEWTKTLNASEAKVVYEMEQSDIKVYWGITDEPIKTTIFSIEAGGRVEAGGVMKGIEGERAFDVDIYKGSIDFSGIHEFYHLQQANDLLQSDPNLKGDDWNKYYENNKMNLEQEVYQRQGLEYSTDDLKDGGY
jgi:RHS repeat-associated protein